MGLFADHIEPGGMALLNGAGPECIDRMMFHGDIEGFRHIARGIDAVHAGLHIGIRFDAPLFGNIGIFDDPEWQLVQVLKNLDDTERWLEDVMPTEPPIEELRQMFTDWMEEQGRKMKLSEKVYEAYTLANPLDMSADGLARYWKKFRAGWL